MRHVIYTLGCALLAAWPAVALAQSTPTPTRQAAASTPEQDAALRSGIEFHDQGKFDAAIDVYQGILKQSPDNTMALYELAYSLAEKKDYARSLEVANRGTAYQSEQLPLFYDLLGSTHDSMGEPQKAIDAYKRGIQVVPDASLLYYNMAVTYLESLNQPDQARLALEQAAALDPTQPTIHLMLGQVFQSNGYSVPGLLAFSTNLIYEPGGPQSLRAYGFFRTILRGGVQSGPSGMQPSGMRDGAMRGGAMAMPMPTSSAKKDEGDFSDVEAQLAVGQRNLMSQMDAGMPEIQALASQVVALFRQIAARPQSQDRSTFTGRHYLPYFLELQKRGYVEPFLYWAIQRAPVDGVQQWLTANQPKVNEFLTWTRDYKWPQP